MRVFRLSKKQYASKLDGKGAAKFNNRWNSKGVEMVYTAQSRALAMAEVLVHLSMTLLPRDYVMVEIEIPDAVRVLEDHLSSDLSNWNQFPSTNLTRQTGDNFIHSKNAVALKVPSAVVPGEFNYLLNPEHPDMIKISIVSIVNFPFDDRLFKT